MLKESQRVSGGMEGKAEVIAAMRNMNQRDEVLAVLTRSNKNFNKDDVRFSVKGGNVQLNGIDVDILNYGSMTKSNQRLYHVELPPMQENLASATQYTSFKFTDIFNVASVMDFVGKNQKLMASGDWNSIVIELLVHFTRPIQTRIIEIANDLINNLTKQGIGFVTILRKVSPRSPIYRIFHFIVGWLREKVDEYESDYQRKKLEEQQQPDYDDVDFHSKYFVHSEKAKRIMEFFDKATKLYTEGPEIFIANLSREFLSWLTTQIFHNDQNEEKKEKRKLNMPRKSKTICSTCGGYYYL